MAYTIVKSNGTVLTTIADGTINTTSTSLGLPGRNYAGYGQALDENFVYLLENFASPNPPANPLTGQLWFNTNNSTMYICPADGVTNQSAWLALTATSSSGNTTFGAVTVTGNLSASNAIFTNSMSANNASLSYLTVSTTANIVLANVNSAVIGTLTTQSITSGGLTTLGNLTGVWTMSGTGTVGGYNGTAVYITNGNLQVGLTGGTIGIHTDNYCYANGAPVSFAGTYNNANVAAYLPLYGGNILAQQVQANTITTGANTNPGTITGNWALTTGSRLISTYADLAERFAADEEYDAGTVVELGGKYEITSVKYELSDDVFGVISNTAAYLMNGEAGNDITHPAVAVTGRVPVKVVGKINKGERLVSAGDGTARAAKPGEATAFNTIGRALASKTTDDVGTVEAIVMIR